MGLLRTAARTAVISGTATAVSGRVARRQAARYDQPAQPGYQQQPVAQPPEPQDDAVSRLQDLARLHGQGVLSAEEFAAAKAKILGI